MKTLNIILIILGIIFVILAAFVIWDIYLKNFSIQDNSQNQTIQNEKYNNNNIINRVNETNKKGNYKNQTKKQNNTNQQNKNLNNNTQTNNQLDSVSVYESDTPIPQLLEQYAGSGLLGRISDKSVTINIIAPLGMQAYVEYGTSPGNFDQKTDVVKSINGTSIEIILNNLSPNTEYYYRINYELSEESNFKTKSIDSFMTQRAEGNSFIFDVQADPHMDGHSDSSVYKTTLNSEARDKPDFLIDLGDDFMTEKFATTSEQVNRRYLELRSYYDIPGSNTPLFLVNGNHEGEFGWLFNSVNKDNDAYWALNARKTYYPNPIPNEFYSGSIDENYYSWKWGDALFVVLDPYSYTLTTQKQDGDMWGWTIGESQYRWFKQTLEDSKEKYKFVFIHHMLGEYRGMTIWADKYEWGGYDKNGEYLFNIKRPGWDMPIHQLMVKNNVTILFQGHDHLFSKEEKDGIIYQEVPQPSTMHGDPAPGTEGQYLGEVLNSSGYMRINVSNQNVSVEYVKTAPSETAGIAYKYSIK